MANPFFSGRIPSELYKAVEDHIKETGDTKTEVLVKALASYLKLPIEPPARSFEISQQEFTNLIERVESLEKIIKAQSTVINFDTTDNDVIKTDSSDIQSQDFVINSDNDGDNTTSEEGETFSSDNNFDNTPALDGIVGPLNEGDMADFIGIHRATLRSYRQKLADENQPPNTPKRVERKADGLIYYLECTGEKIKKSRRPGIGWIAIPEKSDNTDYQQLSLKATEIDNS